MAKKKASSKDSLISRMSEAQIHEIMRLFARVQLAEAASRKAEWASKPKTSYQKRASKKAASKKAASKKATSKKRTSKPKRPTSRR